MHRVLDTVNDHARVRRDVIEEVRDNILLLNELDVGKRLLSEFDSLVKTILTAVRDVDELDNLRLKTRIEHLSLTQLVLKLTGTSEHETLYVDLITSNKRLRCDLADLSQVIMTLLDTETTETNG